MIYCVPFLLLLSLSLPPSLSQSTPPPHPQPLPSPNTYLFYTTFHNQLSTTGTKN